MKNNFIKTLTSKITFWGTVAAVIVAAGLYSTFLRFTQGLGGVTNLNDAFPWGLWIGFDILCGVGLAAGGFTICAVTHIFNIEKFKPLTRPAILTAFLGYVMVIFALMYDLGRPWAIWHAIIMWNTHSVMFEVAWCVMLYTSVLFLEFSPILLERFRMKKTLRVIRMALIPIMILGILLSTLHQSSLGSLYLIVPNKMHPLWWSMFLPVFFFLSAVSVGFAMVIFESYLSAKAFNHGLKLPLLSQIAGVMSVVLIVNLAAKFIDMAYSGDLPYLLVKGPETYLFYLEMLIGTLIPVAILSVKKYRSDNKWLYVAAVMTVGGFVLNRMNVSVTSLEASSSVAYFPGIYEISITLMLVVLGMLAFRFIVQHFPVFEAHKELPEIIVDAKAFHETELSMQHK